MAVVYPGLVNIDASTITVTNVNVYDDNQRTHTYDLTDQIPAFDSALSVEQQAGLSQITLPSPARVNTLMIILDGLTLSPKLSSDPLAKGDYEVITSSKIEFTWDPADLPRRHSADDTPVLLARYTLA